MLLKINPNKDFSPSKVLFLIGAISLSVSWAIFASFVHNLGRMETLWEEIIELKDKSERVANEKNERDFYIKKYGSSEPFYLSKQLSSLSFLATEKEYLNGVLSIPAYMGSSEIKKKLGEIAFQKNHITLQESDRKKKAPLEQIEWKWAAPISVEESDIETILAIVEGVQIKEKTAPEGRPQTFFKEFSLKRKPTTHEFQRYEIDAKIVQRTYAP